MGSAEKKRDQTSVLFDAVGLSSETQLDSERNTPESTNASSKPSFRAESRKDKNLNPVRPWGVEENAFCMLIHLSQFASILFRPAGMILPVVMWATTKDLSEEADYHGRAVINWILSCLIYIVAIILINLWWFKGVPMLSINRALASPLILFLLFGILDIVWIITGAVRANQGKRWRYPFSIPFLRLTHQ